VFILFLQFLTEMSKRKASDADAHPPRSATVRCDCKQCSTDPGGDGFLMVSRWTRERHLRAEREGSSQLEPNVPVTLLMCILISSDAAGSEITA
jgi:hypothetical protein